MYCKANTHHHALLSLALFVTGVCVGQEPAPQPSKPKVDVDGTIHAPAFSVPYSTFASEQARKALVDRALRPPQISKDDIAKARRDVDEQMHKPLMEALNKIFSVSIVPVLIGGVQTDVVTPLDGNLVKDRSRVLINLHGGGFQVAARMGGQIESIPIAALGRIKVITVDYRQAPENKFPAASEDVGTVYSELLKEYGPENIGMYGCSAGGVLTSQALAWFQVHGLPAPGAVGIFGAGATAYVAGDSMFVSNVLIGKAPPSVSSDGNIMRGYFGSGNLDGPLVSPAYSPSVLAKFPPTLVISGTRDFFLSSALYTHTQLTKANVPASLHVWEGMHHCFFFNAELPESHEAWNVIVKFFEKNLGKHRT